MKHRSRSVTVVSPQPSATGFVEARAKHPYPPLAALALKGDPDFLAYYVGIQVGKDQQPTGQLHVSISAPGRSGLRGNVAIDADRLTPANALAARSAAEKVPKWQKEKARVPAPEHAPANRP